MKTTLKKIILNLAICINVLIFGILTFVAFYSIGFQDGVTLSNVAKEVENGSKYFWLVLTGIILVWSSLILFILKLIFRKPFQVMIINITTLVVLTIAMIMMMAGEITFIIDQESDSWKVVGVVALLLIGYGVTIQPQIKLFLTKGMNKEALAE